VKVNSSGNVKVFTFESESFLKFSPLKVEKKCTLKQLLPDPNSPNANALFVGFNDSTKRLLIFCSGRFGFG